VNFLQIIVASFDIIVRPSPEAPEAPVSRFYCGPSTYIPYRQIDEIGRITELLDEIKNIT
jgi:hypothetical protein